MKVYVLVKIDCRKVMLDLSVFGLRTIAVYSSLEKAITACKNTVIGPSVRLIIEEYEADTGGSDRKFVAERFCRTGLICFRRLQGDKWVDQEGTPITEPVDEEN